MHLMALLQIRYGVVANIIASHAIARGSIPRVGIFQSQHDFGVLVRVRPIHYSELQYTAHRKPPRPTVLISRQTGRAWDRHSDAPGRRSA